MPGHLHHVRLMHHSHKDRVAWGWMCGHLACHRWLQVLVSRPPPWPKPEDEPFTQPLCQVLPVALQRVSWPFLQRMSWDLEKGEDSKRVFKFQFNFFEAPRLRPWFSRKADLFLFGNVSSRSLVLRFFNTGARVWWKARPLWALWWFWAHPGRPRCRGCGGTGGGMSCRKADGREKKWWCHFEALIIF